MVIRGIDTIPEESLAGHVIVMVMVMVVAVNNNWTT